MSSSNFLKGFGATADVLGGLSIDKALRRKKTGTVTGFDITNGRVVDGKIATSNESQAFEHGLARVPSVVLADVRSADVTVDRLDAKNIWLTGTAGDAFSLWVV